MQENGNISISTENMFPIIKKWLYSEKDIFIRELTSNCSDAINKLMRLASVGEYSGTVEPKITITVDSELKTLSFTDNGIGMTADEVRRYINQVAFSGAKEFFEKYKDKAEDSQIIGHFGLGFYSAFMVSKKVRIETLSCQPGSTGVCWESEGGMEYTLSECAREEIGTTVTLELDDDSAEFCEKWTVREVLTKYFRFLPIPIWLNDAKDAIKADEKPVNDLAPLWEKSPKECTPEEYQEFYHRVFPDTADPLFWVHLNIDYPFRLKGILYFPKLRNEFESVEGQVKLYCGRVFVADNIKEVIPEYLLLLKGCIDCPDLPLNVSRSFLQNDGTVTRLSAHITRKVADRLMQLFNSERETYNQYWDDINPFIKYGCLRDEKFYDRVHGALLFKTLDGEYITVDEYLENNAEVVKAEDAPAEPAAEAVDGETAAEEKKPEKNIYYATDENLQAQYIAMFRANNKSAVLLRHVLDNHFITMLESKNTNIHFKRIDSDLSELSADVTVSEETRTAVETLFGGIAGEMKLETRALTEGAAPAVLVLSEQSRRFKEMSRMYGTPEMQDLFKEEFTLVINSANPVYSVLAEKAAAGSEDAALLAEQIFDLAQLAQRPLTAAELTKFIQRSQEILILAAK